MKGYLKCLSTLLKLFEKNSADLLKLFQKYSADLLNNLPLIRSRVGEHSRKHPTQQAGNPSNFLCPYIYFFYYYIDELN